MRLRPTACGSTLRETARPSRAGGGPATKCSENSGGAVPGPCGKARWNPRAGVPRPGDGKRASKEGPVRPVQSDTAARGESPAGRTERKRYGRGRGGQEEG